MACTAAACNSGCFKEDGDELVSTQKKGDLTDAPSLTDLRGLPRSICFKCKLEEAIAGDDSRLCLGCFRSSLFGKFKLAVTSNAMIQPTDNVLVAFSGGPSSRVALQFVHEMQNKAQKNFDASRDRSLPVFNVGVAFIDESAVYPIISHEYEKAIQEIRLIVSSLAPPKKELYISPIESICSLDNKDGRSRLRELLNGVSDITGKEDLRQHLRMITLQKIAFDNGYNKLVMGSCTSRIACHVISATVKGKGYSLPADIQYVDARWEVPVVLPLRDCLAEELNMLCHLDSLKTLEVLNSPLSGGINALVSSFVSLLQEENPSRERTIVRTAEKLTPFHFNKIPETNDYNDQLLSRRRHKKFNLKSNESIPSEFFCPICSSPVNKPKLQNLTHPGSFQTSVDGFGIRCCPSCQFQILPKDPLSMEHFYSLLPHQIISQASNGICSNQNWLREQIKDCLLSDDEDGV